MNLSSLFSILQTILVLIIVIILANITLKYSSKYLQKNNKMIKIIERVSVNNNSALCIVDICGKYYLMSISGNENKILKELDKEEIQDFLIDRNEASDVFSWQGIKDSLIEMRKRID